MNANPCKECEYTTSVMQDTMEKPCIACPFFQMANLSMAILRTKPIETISLVVSNELEPKEEVIETTATSKKHWYDNFVSFLSL